MKNLGALFIMGISAFLLAPSQVKAQVVESNNKFIGNSKANNINGDRDQVNLQNNSDNSLVDAPPHK